MSESSLFPVSGAGGGVPFPGMETLERDALLAQLDDLLGGAGRGQGRVVLVKGEAGIGKTTLAREFTTGRERRVRWGMCDPLDPPRPLAPVFDIACEVGGELQSALDEADRNRIVFAFLAMLRSEGGPWIAVLEDMQWADDATLDLLKVIGRRIDKLPALVLVTFREDEVGPGHPLARAIADIPRASLVAMDVPHLSVAAVKRMSGDASIDATLLHRVTAGNPYFVSEVLASGLEAVPTSLRDAVLARVARLSTRGQRYLRTAAVLGQRCDSALVAAVSGLGAAELEECVTRGMLRRDGEDVEFRHELSRRSVLDAMSSDDREELHRRALSELEQPRPAVDLAELVRHAAGAGDRDAVLRLAPRAGAQAAALGSHRAAAAHYGSALTHARRLPPRELAELLAAHARECFLTDELERALASERSALEIWRSLGDELNEGRSLTRLAHYEWWVGLGTDACDTAARAVTILEALPPGPDLAAAYARCAQLMMIMGRTAESIAGASKAIELADELGDEQVAVGALNSLGCALIDSGRDEGWEPLEQSLERAVKADLEEEVARSFNNLIACSVNGRRYAKFDTYTEEAAVFFGERELDQSERCLIGSVIEAQFALGRWDEAARIAAEVVDRGQFGGRTEALAVLGRIAARRGEADAMSRLDLALERQPMCGGEVGYPLRAYIAEGAWLAGDLRRAAAELDAASAALSEDTNPWYVGDLAWVAKLVGVDLPVGGQLPEPHAFYLQGYPQKAAAAWAEIGCPYEEAAMLAESPDEADLRRSLSILRSLGAAPLAKVVEERLKALGARRIPRGPRASTLANPAGLSDREVEVLRLLGEGMRNAEIASRLVVSTRTVDHHVSAILAKLGTRSRFEAARRARELGLLEA